MNPWIQLKQHRTSECGTSGEAPVLVINVQRLLQNRKRVQLTTLPLHISVRSPLIEGDNLAVHDGIVRQLCQSRCYRGISCTEIVLIARPQPDAPRFLRGDGAVAIELELVQPHQSFRQSLRS